MRALRARGARVVCFSVRPAAPGDLLSAAFILAIKLFAPVLIALLLTSLVMGFLGRTMPQLNILTIGFALRSMSALAVAAVALAASQDVLVEAIAKHGKDSVAFYGSGQAYTEESYAANKFFKGGFGTNNVEKTAPKLIAK